MSLFKKFANNASKLEEAKDSVGGYSVLETDIYKGTVKLAYLDVWGSGAHYVDLTLTLNGKDYNEKIAITNKQGENFYEKNGKNYPLPGFVTIDDICLVTVGKGLADMDEETEEKTVNVYDHDAGKEIPKVKQVLVGILGKPVAVAIQKSVETKMEKDADGKYTVATNETRDSNAIEKVFEPETMMTTVEARAEKTEGEFYEVWLDKNKGKTRDKTVKGGAAGKPVGAKPTAPPQVGGATTATRKPLFGNKG